MELAKYLAEKLANYIDNMHKKGYPMDFTEEGLTPVLREALRIYKLEAGVLSMPQPDLSH